MRGLWALLGHLAAGSLQWLAAGSEAEQPSKPRKGLGLCRLPAGVLASEAQAWAFWGEGRDQVGPQMWQISSNNAQLQSLNSLVAG